MKEGVRDKEWDPETLPAGWGCGQCENMAGGGGKPLREVADQGDQRAQRTYFTGLFWRV